MAAGGTTGERAADLRSFVPRGSLRWLREQPETRHRAVDGTLVFVDISGFTAMSERLARAGPVGAEEVTDILNQVFSRLLAVAYEEDGSLLKFGGDALLLLFEDGAHTARGVHAAWGMRAKLRELQPLASSAGQVRLRMSIGVHTGTIDQFLVGSGHRELVIAGPAATTTVRMEAAAGPGQIMLSDAVVAALGNAVTTEPRTPGHLLRRAPRTPSVTAIPAPKDVAPELAAALVSPQVAQRLGAGIPQAEHRHCVVGFVRFGELDDHLHRRGPDATAAALEHLVDAAVDAGRADDVCLLSTDVDADGGKLILTAGVPTSEEFDGERMLRTLRQIVAAERRFPLKVGAHCGPVFAGVVGPWFRLTYTIIGDAVNLAARVMGHAIPGEVLATPEVLNRSQALFALDPVPPFAVKGKKHPVTAFRVGAPTAARLRRSRARFRLAGRQTELAALLAAVDKAVLGPGHLVQLSGPAGLGKSRLVDEVHERRVDVPLVMTSCSRHESATPYHVAGDVVRTILGAAATTDPASLRRAVERVAPGVVDTLPLLGDVVGVEVADTDATRDLSPAFRTARAVAAVGDLLEAALPEPAVLVVEDVHWIDQESQAVLRHLARTVLPRRRWALVLTARHRVVLDPKDDFGESHLELAPLDPAAARELAYAAVEEGLVSLERAQLIVEKAGGNPFFLQELLQVGGEGEVPDTVDALIQTQLDQLPPADRQLLGDAAVLGAEIDLELLADIAGISPREQRRAFRRLDAFVEPGPPREGGRARPAVFRFRHTLVHDAAYARLPFRYRRRLHRRAAAALEAEGRERRADLLALHTYHAGEWVRARCYALEAAAAAGERYANLTAAQQYRHAIESGRYIRGLATEDVAADWERLGDALMRASSYDEAVDAYQRAKRLAAPGHQVRICGQLGQLRERQGRYAEALRWFSRALRLEATTPTGAEGRMLVESAIVRNRQGRPVDAMALADRAAACAGGDVQVLARASYVQAWAAMLQGRDAREERQRTLELFEEADDVIGQGLAYNIISMSAYYRGDWDEAALAYERAAELRRRVGDEVAAAAVAGNLGELLADQGHFDRARGLLEECRSVCAAAGFQSSRYFASMTLGRLDARVGRFPEAAAQLTEALAALEAIGMPSLVYDARRYLAELAVFEGDLDTALERAAVLEGSANLGTAGLRTVGRRIRLCTLVLRGAVDDALAAADELLASLADGARDHDTALALVAAAVAYEQAGHARAAGARTEADQALARLGVVVAGEALVFGPNWRATCAQEALPLTLK